MQLATRELPARSRRRVGVALPVILLAALIGGGVYLFTLLRPTVRGVVIDDYTGQPLSGVAVTFGNERLTTGDNGAFTFNAVRTATTLTTEPPAGYVPATQEVRAGRVTGLRVRLRPTTLSGTIIRVGTNAPLANLQVRAIDANGATSTDAVTAADGRFMLNNVPENARLEISGPGVSRHEVDVSRQTVVEVAVRPDVLAGVVRAKDGTPIKGARVSVPGQLTTTKADGSYVLNGIPETGQVVVLASGYKPQRANLGDALTQDFTLEPLIVRALYMTADTIANDAKFNALIALADRTEVNAMVLDLKDSTGWVFFDSQNPTARAIGAVHPAYDIRQRLQVLKEHHIYAIGRIVAMEDPILATARPELAIRNSKTGGVWKTTNGVAWVNATRPEVWQYLTSLAVEAAQLGFDEVQFDYVRFPSDGDIEAIDLGVPDTLPVRTKAIHDFLSTAHDALSPLGVALAADIFGIALWDRNDNGIGQQLESLAPAVDYLCPMVYPSHFAPGSMGFGIPNDHPYEVILQSLQMGGPRIENAKQKFRPWLQDFTYGKGIAYGPNEVLAQIKATYDFGATGWLLWNADNVFTEAALQPKGR